MRIWIINHYALPPSSAGGTRHYNLAKQLIKRGHDVTIIAADYNHFSQCYNDTNISYDVPFLWLHTPPYKGNTVSRFWNMLVFSFKLFQKKTTEHLNPPDLIIGSSPHLFSAYSAMLLARRFKVPFFLEIRDIWPDTLVELGKISKNHPLILLMKWIELRLYRKADTVITLLPAADKYLIQQGVVSEKILWLPNAIDADHFPEQLMPEQHEKFTVMYAGAHGLANDLDTVLNAAKLLQAENWHDKIRILLVGDGPDKKRLQQRVRDEAITMVEFLDAVPKKDVYTLLNKADAYMMLLKSSPIFQWGISPNKLFDYLLMGRPVIFGVDTPFNPIETNKAGITIPPSHDEALATAIKTLYLTPAYERMNMGQRGKEYVLGHHDIAQLSIKLEACILPSA